jgi:carbonic anhydrase
MKPSIRLLLTVLGPWLVYGSPASAQETAAPNFSYTGDTGPAFWGEMSPTCATAPFARQSPVDIRRVIQDASLAPLDLILNTTSYNLDNPGYTIRAVPQVESVLMLNRMPFNLVEFHFHTLAEHTVDGQYPSMELHVVFQNPDTKNLAVIGVLYSIGRANRFLATLLTAGLPVKSTSPPVTVNSLNIGNAFTDTSSYYTYPGSLTTPPCSETVTWLVLQQAAQMSAAQYNAFRGILGNDFRPIQPLNGRVIRGTVKQSSSSDGQDTQPNQ